MTTQSPDKQETTIKVSGRFDYDIVQDFRKAYTDKDPNNQFIVDLSETNYLDSSALGMLIHLWKFTGQDRNKIQIINCNAEIKKIFDITHFERNFIIK